MLTTDSLQWIFVGGKGGVGKTTTSCAIAIELARKRESVLILSTDPAHNLSDAFSQKFSNVPKRIDGFSNLYAMEIDSSTQETMEFKLDGDDSGFFKLIPELLSAFPGIDEAMSFAELMNAVRKMNYSAIVFDTAPTGHTLRLISFPDLLEKGLSKLVNLREKMSGALSMVSSMAGNMLNEEEMHQKLDSVRALTASVRNNFQNPTVTTFVCVCIPEFLSVYETERLIQELARHNMDTSNIVVNQVLFPLEEADRIKLDMSVVDAVKPETATATELQLRKMLCAAHAKIGYLEQNLLCRRKMQSKYLREIDELYTDFHVVPMPLQPQEVRGIDALRHFATLLMTPRQMPIVTTENDL